MVCLFGVCNRRLVLEWTVQTLQQLWVFQQDATLKHTVKTLHCLSFPFLMHEVKKIDFQVLYRLWVTKKLSCFAGKRNSADTVYYRIL